MKKIALAAAIIACGIVGARAYDLRDVVGAMKEDGISQDQISEAKHKCIDASLYIEPCMNQIRKMWEKTHDWQEALAAGIIMEDWNTRARIEEMMRNKRIEMDREGE